MQYSDLCRLALLGLAGAAALLGVPSAALAQDEGAPAAIHPRCAAPEYRLMDYMIGDWDVVETRTGNHFLFNHVESVNAGCAIRENLIMRGDVPGMGLTFRSTRDGRWFQFYHSPGLHGVLEGTTNGDGVNELTITGELPGLSGVQTVHQVTRRDSAGRPHQLGRARPAAGGDWQVVWDITFCPRDPQAPQLPPCQNASVRPVPADN